MTKRAWDVLFAALGLLLAVPLFIAIALAIKLDSPGRVFFSQRRLGKDGKPFLLHKFRKFPDSWGGAGPGVTVAGDARMTRTGRFLERTKLDELPQLWNILCGEMSFVGPRPESMQYADLFKDELAEVLEYVPGIFGPSQIVFRNESAMYPPDQDPEAFYRTVLFPKKAHGDIAYFRNSNVFRDLGWVFRGILVSFSGAVDWRRTIGLHGRILAFDLLAIEAAWLLANLVRFEGLPPGTNMPVFVTGLWLLPAVLLPFMILAGVYRHPIRHFALSDGLRLGLAAMIGWALAYLILIGLLHRYASFFLAPFGFLLTLSLMVGVRLWRREWWRKTARVERYDKQVHIVVYGAGRRGNALAYFLENGFTYAKVIGFLDDNDLVFRGRVVLGRKVLGSERDLNTIHAVYAMDQLWTTFEPETQKCRRLQDWCDANGVELVVVPTATPFSTLSYPVSEFAVPDSYEEDSESPSDSLEHREGQTL